MAMRQRRKFLPFACPSISKEEINEVVDTLKKGWLTFGPKTKIFEEKFAEYIGCKHAISVNSCTAALFLALRVNGIGPGDEVITTPLTFAATGNVVYHLGAKPVLADIDENTLNIDPKEIKKCITKKTKAIIPVHFAGQPCEMDEITEIAKDNNLQIIEDAAHTVGAEYKGKKIGTMGNLACFSFYAIKNLTTGEGGMITTDNSEIAKKIQILRLHGISRDAWKRYTQEGTWYYEILEGGYKFNMTDINASIGLPQLKKIDQFNKKREELVKLYRYFLKDAPNIKFPQIKENIKHSNHLFIVRVPKRDEVIKCLTEKNIGTSVHFIPLHLHPFYQRMYGYKKGDFPIAEKVYEHSISLPLYPSLKDKDVAYVSESLKEILTNL